MRVFYQIVYISLTIILIGKIDCQVVLTRQLLDEWFGDDLTNLNILNLERRQIVSIDRQAFKGLTKLNTLNLDSNQINRIEDFTFYYLNDLRILRLQDNSIISIPTSVFLGLTNLEDVYLQGNPVYEMYGQEYLQTLCSPNPNCIVH